MSEETVTFNLEINLAPTYSEIRKLEAVLFRCLSIVERLSGDEKIDALINKIQRAITIIRMFQVALHALQVVSGPVGWMFAITAGATAWITLNETIYDATRGM